MSTSLYTVCIRSIYRSRALVFTALPHAVVMNTNHGRRTATSELRRRAVGIASNPAESSSAGDFYFPNSYEKNVGRMTRRGNGRGNRALPCHPGVYPAVYLGGASMRQLKKTGPHVSRQSQKHGGHAAPDLSQDSRKRHISSRASISSPKSFARSSMMCCRCFGRVKH